MNKTKLKPDFIYRNNKPVAEIIKIKEYEEILEVLEEKEDLEFIQQLKQDGIETFDFDNYLNERGIIV